MKKEEKEIKVRCQKCKKCLFCYSMEENGNRVVVHNISLKCERCKRMISLKHYTEKIVMCNMVNGCLLV